MCGTLSKYLAMSLYVLSETLELSLEIMIFLMNLNIYNSVDLPDKDPNCSLFIRLFCVSRMTYVICDRKAFFKQKRVISMKTYRHVINR